MTLPENQRTELVTVALTPTEVQALEAHAKQADSTVDDLLRVIALAWDSHNAASLPMPTSAATDLLDWHKENPTR